MNIITRTQAFAEGLNKYFTGVPCHRGHIAERYVKNHRCVQCQRDDSARHRAETMPPTGYKRGRPRKGEVRPPSINAIKTDVYRKKRLAVDPEFRKRLNEYAKD